MNRFKNLSLAALLAVAVTGIFTASTASAQMKDPEVGGAAMYPSKNIIENAVNSKDHTTLVAAVKAGGLVDTLEGAGPFTVFAPTNEAFAKLPPGTLDMLLKPENKEKLRAILLYHVHPGAAITAKECKTMDLSTADEGKVLHVKVDGDTVMINDAKVIKADIPASNGEIHWIDTVLMPPE